jgi:hypothetical protein
VENLQTGYFARRWPVTPQERMESALRSPDPARSLRLLVLELSQQGHKKDDIYERLEKLLIRVRTRADFRESDEDVVLDVMDALTGWCHPDAQLPPDTKPAG